MSFLKELTDKGATIAWSNVAAHPSLIALGTKVRHRHMPPFYFLSYEDFNVGSYVPGDTR